MRIEKPLVWSERTRQMFDERGQMLQEMSARLAAAERVVEAARVLAARVVLGIPPVSDTARVIPEHIDPPAWWDDVEDKLDAYLAAERGYDAAVPARGDRRAPEGGSTPPAAIGKTPSGIGDYEGKPATPENIVGLLTDILDEGTKPENLNISEREGE